MNATLVLPRSSQTVLPVLQFLWGRPWREEFASYLSTLRPSVIEFVGACVKTDARAWRVRVRLNEDKTIHHIEQEVVIGLSDKFDHAHHFNCTMRQVHGLDPDDVATEMRDMWTWKQRPTCPKWHCSKDHDLDWYFVCCGGPRLVWRQVDGKKELHPVDEDMKDEQGSL